MVERFLLVWLTLLSALAYLWPRLVPGGWSFDPFVASKPPYLYYLFAATMFAIGGLLPLEEIRRVRSRWWTVLGGTTLQYLTMPLLGLAVAQTLGFTGGWYIGLVLVGCVPGAMASNVLTLMARGNVSYSVSLTTLATLASPLVVPWTLKLALGAEHPLDVWETFVFLCWTVVAPVIAGFVLSQCSSAADRVFKAVGSTFANLSILWIIAVVVALNRDRIAQTTGLMLLALLTINLLGYAAGNLGGRAMRLDAQMRRALTLEIGLQNAGLGTLMATKLFADLPEAAIAPAFYTFGCMLTGSMLARFWATRQLDATAAIDEAAASAESPSQPAAE